MAKDLLRKELSQQPCRDLYLAAMRRTAPNAAKAKGGGGTGAGGTALSGGGLGTSTASASGDTNSANDKTDAAAAAASMSSALASTELGPDEARAHEQLLQASTHEMSWAHFCTYSSLSLSGPYCSVCLHRRALVIHRRSSYSKLTLISRLLPRHSCIPSSPPRLFASCLSIFFQVRAWAP